MLSFLLRFFFPSPCRICGVLSEALCSRCYDALPFYPHVRELPGLRVYSSLYYDESPLLPRLLHPFKYQAQADLFRLFTPPMKRAAELMTVDFRDWNLVPVPIHQTRLLERGYNQAELLARAVAKALGCRFVDALQRMRDTRHQAHASTRTVRMENIKDAFGVRTVMKGPVVLVDDVVTSGATLLECARVLRERGANVVAALTLADREKKAYRDCV